MNDASKAGRKGFSLRRVNRVMAIGMIAISLLLLFFAYRITDRFRDLRTATYNYIDWQRGAYDLQIASDYLTEQVRCFAVTGDVAYLWDYFEEAEISRRRDKALELLREHLGDTQAYAALSSAMEESVALMEREYDSMRLVIEARGYDLSKLPEALRSRSLPEGASLLAPEDQEELARELVFDETYRLKKEAISSHMQRCLDELVRTTETLLHADTASFRSLLRVQQILIIVMILLVISIVFLTAILIIRPLSCSIDRVRAEQPIPTDRGSEEFRFLAAAFNQISEANRERREALAFEAAHDKLTGLYNRSGYDVLLSKVDWGTSALLVLDVDLFKSVNDTYGHEMGDRVLRWVASVLRESFRSGDYVCRIGGDEFSIIMLRTSRDHRDMIRQKVETINKALSIADEGLIPVSVSVGVAYGETDRSFEQIFKAADGALYRVKKTGRSGCAFAD